MQKNGDCPFAFVKHRLPGRVRLKIPEKRGDFCFFDRLADALTECTDVTQLQLNPPAASVLISYRTENAFQMIADFAEARGLFSLSDKPYDDPPISLSKLPLTALTSNGLSMVDHSLVDVSSGRLDGRSLLFLALLGLAVHQLVRGNVMAPAATLLWYALQLLERENEKNNA
ncbi:MAG: hypothetical protein Kow0065_11770 [Methylomicrobium sp.]